jgi:YD repeat-containing protein
LNRINNRLMKNILLVFLLLTTIAGHSQYYYKDLLGTEATNHQLKLYSENKVKTVSLKSFDADGSLTTGFVVEQVFDNTVRVLKTISKSGVTEESVLSSWFDENARVIKTIDTSGSSINTAVYSYDGQGRLSSIRSFSGDTSGKSDEAEDHQWTYASNGQPIQMLRIINTVDTTVIKLMADDAGNITQETNYKKGSAGDPVYYYYNEKKQLTDIVRYNYKLKKLLPDYMFEYSAASQVIQKITVPSNKASDYLIWRYQYDTNGLKTREALFTKNKQLTGKIEYSYQLGS